LKINSVFLREIVGQVRNDVESQKSQFRLVEFFISKKMCYICSIILKACKFMTVTAEIDITRPTGRKLVRELERKRCVTLHYENPGASGVWHDFKDVNNRALDKMSEHYGVDMRSLVAKYSKYKTCEV